MTATLTKRKGSVKPSKRSRAEGNDELPTDTSAATAKPAEYRLLPVEQLHESPTNPRKVFRGLEELAASMNVHGVLEPLLARPWPADCPTQWKRGNEHWQLVAGARRLRAAKLAELTEVPVIVRELTDKDVLEIQVIENDQREDVQPMDQAFGYQALIDKCGYDAAAIAAKIGRSETYVYQRLQLTNLIPKFVTWLQEDRIMLGHAQLVARLSAKQQEKLLKDWIFQSMEGWKENAAPSITKLRDTIEGLFHLNLKSSLFPKDLDQLVKGCGPCTTCSKRTGNNPSLWPEVSKEDTCTDPACFKSKERAFVQLQIKKAEEKAPDVVRISVNSYSDKKNGVLGRHSYEILDKKSAKKVPAAQLKTAVIIDKETYGDSSNKPGRVVQIRVKPASKDGSSSSSSNDDWEKERERKRIRGEFLSKVQQAAIRRVSESITGPTSEELIKAVISNTRFDNDHLADLCERHGLPTTGGERQKLDRLLGAVDEVQLHRLLFETLHQDAWKADSWNLKLDAELVDHASIYGVDVKKIESELKAEKKAAAKPDKKEPAGKASTRAKGKKKAAVTGDAGEDDADEDGAGATEPTAAEGFDDDAIPPNSAETVCDIPKTLFISVVQRAGGRWATYYRAHLKSMVLTPGASQSFKAQEFSGRHASRAEAITAAADAVDTWLKKLTTLTGTAANRAKEIRAALDRLDKSISKQRGSAAEQNREAVHAEHTHQTEGADDGTESIDPE